MKKITAVLKEDGTKQKLVLSKLDTIKPGKGGHLFVSQRQEKDKMGEGVEKEKESHIFGEKRRAGALGFVVNETGSSGCKSITD